MPVGFQPVVEENLAEISVRRFFIVCLLTILPHADWRCKRRRNTADSRHSDRGAFVIFEIWRRAKRGGFAGEAASQLIQSR